MADMGDDVLESSKGGTNNERGPFSGSVHLGELEEGEFRVDQEVEVSLQVGLQLGFVDSADIVQNRAIFTGFEERDVAGNSKEGRMRSEILSGVGVPQEEWRFWN
ncbi:hypothetical protein OROHE_009883 [Orobanche hederae]